MTIIHTTDNVIVGTDNHLDKLHYKLLQCHTCNIKLLRIRVLCCCQTCNNSGRIPKPTELSTDFLLLTIMSGDYGHGSFYKRNTGKTQDSTPV